MWIKYTDEEREFFREFIPGHSYREISEEFSRRFRTITDKQVQAYCKNNKIPTGRGGHFKKGHVSWNKGIHYTAPGAERTWFRKGNRPHDWRPVGSERVTKDGYIEIKVKEPNRWDLKHRVVWEQHNGPIQEGNIILFRDGNRQNVDIDNLVMVSRAINARLTVLGLQGAGELMDAAITAAKVSEEIAKRRRK